MSDRAQSGAEQAASGSLQEGAQDKIIFHYVSVDTIKRGQSVATMRTYTDM